MEINLIDLMKHNIRAWKNNTPKLVLLICMFLFILISHSIATATVHDEYIERSQGLLRSVYAPLNIRLNSLIEDYLPKFEDKRAKFYYGDNSPCEPNKKLLKKTDELSIILEDKALVFEIERQDIVMSSDHIILEYTYTGCNGYHMFTEFVEITGANLTLMPLTHFFDSYIKGRRSTRLPTNATEVVFKTLSSNKKELFKTIIKKSNLSESTSYFASSELQIKIEWLSQGNQLELKYYKTASRFNRRSSSSQSDLFVNAFKGHNYYLKYSLNAIKSSTSSELGIPKSEFDALVSEANISPYITILTQGIWPAYLSFFPTKVKQETSSENKLLKEVQNIQFTFENNGDRDEISKFFEELIFNITNNKIIDAR